MKGRNEVQRKSLPMPIRVKTTILNSYEYGLNYLDSYRACWFSESFRQTYFRLFYSEVINLYSMLRVRMETLKKSAEYKELYDLEDYVGKFLQAEDISEDLVKKFIAYFSLLEKLLYELGITETEVTIGEAKKRLRL